MVPASYAEEDHMFRPMHKEVVFNAKLKHNDGLLAERYMQDFGVTFQRACRMLEEDVTAISDELVKGLNVRLGEVGSLSLGNEGQLIFAAGNSDTFSIDSYGLAPFQLKTWELLQQDSSNEETGDGKKRTLHKPVNRRILRIVTASAAAIAAFFLISTPVKEISRAAYTASFLPSHSELSDNTSANGDLDIHADDDAILTPEAFGALSSTDNDYAPVEDNRLTIEPIVTDEEPSPAAAPGKTETYYIIIASVNSRAKASEFVAGIDSKVMPNASVLVSGSQIRIYADSFTDRSRAEAFLAEVRSNPQFADAWMFTQRGTSK
jgi:hypothetical protein